jgi:hypothetical protein
MFTDEMHLARQKSRSDAEFYQMQRQAEANKLLLTPQYLELKKFEAISSNNKVYFGNNIPNMFMQGGCAGEEKSMPSEAKMSSGSAMENSSQQPQQQHQNSGERTSVRS